MRSDVCSNGFHLRMELVSFRTTTLLQVDKSWTSLVMSKGVHERSGLTLAVLLFLPMWEIFF